MKTNRVGLLMHHHTERFAASLVAVCDLGGFGFFADGNAGPHVMRKAVRINVCAHAALHEKAPALTEALVLLGNEAGRVAQSAGCLVASVRMGPTASTYESALPSCSYPSRSVSGLPLTRFSRHLYATTTIFGGCRLLPRPAWDRISSAPALRAL